MTTASELLRELQTKTWPRRALAPGIRTQIDHLLPVVEALEEALSYKWSRDLSGRHPSLARHEARQALADLHAALTEALKETQDA